MFCDFYIVYFLINFSFVTSYNDGLLPDPRTSKNQRTPSLIQGFLKCMAPIACICFMKYKSFQHFILPELCWEKKHIVGNKAKGPISKRVFQENKARQIF